jgi:hypothetical protein
VGLDQYEVSSWTGWYRHITFDASARLLDGDASEGRRRRSRSTKKAAATEELSAEELVPLTVPEVRRLLWWLVWGRLPSEQEVLDWSKWRRRHQATAKRCHYKRRAAQMTHLQL